MKRRRNVENKKNKRKTMVQIFEKKASKDFMKALLTPFLPHMENQEEITDLKITEDNGVFIIKYLVEEV